MQSNKPWTRQKLTQMLYHAFIGSLADNAIEIGWVLCFSLLAILLILGVSPVDLPFYIPYFQLSIVSRGLC